MDIGVIGIVLIAFTGPLLIYLTRHVIRGRTPTAMRLWFVSVGTYVVYYLLANGKFIAAEIEPYYFALLWPIPAILTFWFVERTTRKDSPVYNFRWMIYFMAGVIFAFVVDTIGGMAGWYDYLATVTSAASIANPLTGAQVPAIVLLMLGVMMAGVFFLSDSVFQRLKPRVGAASSTYILIGLAFVMGGLVWVISDFLLGQVR